MARFKHLEIYRTMYSGFRVANKCIAQFRREYKFTIGERIRNEMIEIFVLIGCANSRKDRAGIIDDLISRVDVVMLMLRLSNDLGILPDERYEELVGVMDSVARQAAGWKKYKPVPMPA